jgi:hypothetical protein
MSRIIRLVLMGGAFIAATRQADAAITFKATLTHDQEVSNPPIPNEGSSGVGTFVLNDAQTQLSYDVQLFGLDIDGLQTADPNDNVTRAHFHRAAAGNNGGIVFGMIDSSASFRNDNNPNDLIVTPATGRITGIWNLNEGASTTLGAELPFLLNNGLYFNIHTSDHGGGEIRGQVIQIPEPATAILFGAAIAGMACLRRR